MKKFTVASETHDLRSMIGSDQLVVDAKSKVIICLAKSNMWAELICDTLNANAKCHDGDD
jgi:hypothetical protein